MQNSKYVVNSLKIFKPPPVAVQKRFCSVPLQAESLKTKPKENPRDVISEVPSFPKSAHNFGSSSLDQWFKNTYFSKKSPRVKKSSTKTATSKESKQKKKKNLSANVKEQLKQLPIPVFEDRLAQPVNKAQKEQELKKMYPWNNSGGATFRKPKYDNAKIVDISKKFYMRNSEEDTKSRRSVCFQNKEFDQISVSTRRYVCQEENKELKSKGESKPSNSMQNRNNMTINSSRKPKSSVPDRVVKVSASQNKIGKASRENDTTVKQKSKVVPGKVKKIKNLFPKFQERDLNTAKANFKDKEIKKLRFKEVSQPNATQSFQNIQLNKNIVK